MLPSSGTLVVNTYSYVYITIQLFMKIKEFGKFIFESDSFVYFNIENLLGIIIWLYLEIFQIGKLVLC